MILLKITLCDYRGCSYCQNQGCSLNNPLDKANGRQAKARATSKPPCATKVFVRGQNQHVLKGIFRKEGSFHAVIKVDWKRSGSSFYAHCNEPESRRKGLSPGPLALLPPSLSPTPLQHPGQVLVKSPTLFLSHSCYFWVPSCDFWMPGLGNTTSPSLALHPWC